MNTCVSLASIAPISSVTGADMLSLAVGNRVTVSLVLVNYTSACSKMVGWPRAERLILSALAKIVVVL